MSKHRNKAISIAIATMMTITLNPLTAHADEDTTQGNTTDVKAYSASDDNNVETVVESHAVENVEITDDSEIEYSDQESSVDDYVGTEQVESVEQESSVDDYVSTEQEDSVDHEEESVIEDNSNDQEDYVEQDDSEVYYETLENEDDTQINNEDENASEALVDRLNEFSEEVQPEIASYNVDKGAFFPLKPYRPYVPSYDDVENIKKDINNQVSQIALPYINISPMFDTFWKDLFNQLMAGNVPFEHIVNAHGTDAMKQYVKDNKKNTQQAPLAVQPAVHVAPQVAAQPVKSAPQQSPKAQQAVNFAHSRIGTPYVWGGTTDAGYDCSGFVQAAYRSAGVELPRTSQQQAQYGRTVSYAELQPGDLVFYGDGGPASSYHAAIYIGDGKVIHAPQAGESVKISPVNMMRISSLKRVS